MVVSRTARSFGAVLLLKRASLQKLEGRHRVVRANIRARGSASFGVSLAFRNREQQPETLKGDIWIFRRFAHPPRAEPHASRSSGFRSMRDLCGVDWSKRVLSSVLSPSRRLACRPCRAHSPCGLTAGA